MDLWPGFLYNSAELNAMAAMARREGLHERQGRRLTQKKGTVDRMKRILAWCCLALMLLLPLVPGNARAEVFMEAPPEDWADKETLTLIAFKTGRSDCTLILCGGESMLVDGGYNAYREQLADALDARGLRHLSILFNTHPHDDHVAGMTRLLEMGFDAKVAMSPFKEDFADKYGFQQVFVRRLAEAGVPYHQVHDGDVILLGGAVLTVICQDTVNGVNERSAALNVRFGESTVLLMADIPGTIQRQLLESRDQKLFDVDILKAAHHGINPMVKEFMDAVDPALVFVHNFPKYATGLENQTRYRKIPLLYASQGTITMVTDGTDWYVTQTRGEF